MKLLENCNVNFRLVSRILLPLYSEIDINKINRFGKNIILMLPDIFRNDLDLNTLRRICEKQIDLNLTFFT